MSMSINDSISVILPGIIGDDSILGKISEKDKIAIKYNKVRLFYQKTGAILFELSSDKNGVYEFNGIDFKKGPFFIIAHDPSGKYNGVIADNIGGKNVVD